MDQMTQTTLYLDHLGHFVDGSSRSHLQTNLSGCGLDFNGSHDFLEKDIGA